MNRRLMLKSAACAAGSVLTQRFGLAVPVRASADGLAGWLEQASGDRLIEQVVQRIHDGLRYEDLLAALTVAAVHNVQPRPDVGFKYHAVMVLQSLYLTSVTLPPEKKWLPLLWGIDSFKRSQLTESRQTGWRMSPVSAARVSRDRAERALMTALEAWDVEAAESAVVQMVRATSWQETSAFLLPYFTRDFRELGHKPITGANTLRMLHLNDGYGGEAMLRSAVVAILNPGNDTNPGSGDYRADRAWRQNSELVKEVADIRQRGRMDWVAAQAMLEMMRSVSDLEAGRELVSLLKQGIAPEVLWETLVLVAAELMLRTGSFAALHANTMINSLHYLYRQTADTTIQQLLLLQSASLLALFRDSSGRSRRQLTIETLEPSSCDDLDLIFETLARSRFEAVRLALGFLDAGGNASGLTEKIRYYTVYYTGNSHDYKYAEAILEEYPRMLSPWRNHYLAVSMLWVNGPQQPRNPVIEQARDAGITR